MVSQAAEPVDRVVPRSARGCGADSGPRRRTLGGFPAFGLAAIARLLAGICEAGPATWIWL